ncbi:MAG: hypothetical protein HN509_02340 [Halobacteriovoraceae bacterium]|jgi:hypothetical protein|nr:hypothetical protein [Halobacteriovoraceae bacterium]
MSKIKLLLLPLLLIVMFPILLFLGTNSYETIYFSKIWRHRGGEVENNIKSIRKSIEEGYRGIEVDVRHSSKKLLLSHDPIAKEKKYDSLEDLLISVAPEKINVWIDLKSISLVDYINVASKLGSLLKKTKMDKKAFVESKGVLLNCVLRFYDVPTVLWYEKKSTDMKNFVYESIIGVLIPLVKIQGISFDKVFSKSKFVKNSKLKKHWFTFKTDAELEEGCLSKNDVLLTSVSYNKLMMIKNCR